MPTEEEVKPNPAWKIALVGGPLFLLLSSVWAMWIWYKKDQEEDLDPRLALPAQEVGVAELGDHLRKLRDLIGGRDWDTPEGRAGMRRAIAFIGGTLSPQNYGFLVKRGAEVTHAGERWPSLWVDLAGTGKAKELILVTVPYDADDLSVPVALATVNALRAEELTRTVRFLFLPSGLLEGGQEAFGRSLLRKGESLVATVAAAEAVPPELFSRNAGAEDLKPVAQELTGRVRKIANDP